MGVDADCKAASRQIRNYLVGRFFGATRDENLFQETFKCLCCKIYIQQQDRELEKNDAEAIPGYYHAFV